MQECEKDFGGTTGVVVDLFGRMGCKLSAQAISEAFRTEASDNTKHRPILVRLVRKEDRKWIFMNKKNLKSQPSPLNKVHVEDSLTKERSFVFRKLMNDERVKFVSTRNGRVLVNLEGALEGEPGSRGKPLVIDRLRDLYQLGLHSRDEATAILSEAFSQSGPKKK